ncbi:HAD family hydrolase [Alteromonas sp. NFXS44]|uniref:HAD family hydrolase n=1 Tax=Alteromonas sp. NFXS44 TaxID=2818435 RepID=UPI0032DFDAFF
MQAVIFDLFNTLVFLQTDSRPFYRLAKKSTKMSVRHALQLSLTRNYPTLQEYALDVCAEESFDQTSLEKHLLHDLASLKLYDDVVPELNALKSRGVMLGLVSNIASIYIPSVERTGLMSLFDSVVFSCDAGYIKPEPEIYYSALDELGLKPSDALFVGDNFRADVKGPRGVGMHAIQIKRGKRTNLNNDSIARL